MDKHKIKKYRFKHPKGFIHAFKTTRSDRGILRRFLWAIQRRKNCRCSIIYKGKYIFSPEEAKKYRPDLVEEFYI